MTKKQAVPDKDTVETALYEGNGTCYIDIDGVTSSFSNKFEADGIEFQIPTINTFSFNSPIGACPKCEGYGKILGIDEDLVVPDKMVNVSIGSSGHVLARRKNERVETFFRTTCS